MASFVAGNMWEVFQSADRFIVLCSSTIDRDGRAVFNTGLGKELIARFPEANIPESVGKYIHETCGNHGIFGLRAEAKVGVFQDRRHFKDELDTYCFGSACAQLRMKAQENPDLEFHVELATAPFWLIKGPVELCPDNVIFWSKP